MPGKENAGTVEEKALMWAYDARLNADMAFEPATDGSEVFFVRLRPWENKQGKGDMYFGYGKSLLIAFRMAVKAFNEGEPQRLDYSYRPWRVERQRSVAVSPFD